jgi:predicted N-acyltransferase
VLVQPFFLNDQDITEGLGAGLRAPLLGLRRWFPRFLKMRMLMVGSTGGEGSLGLTIPASDPAAIDALHATLEALLRYGRENGVAVITFKDFKKTWRDFLTVPAAARGFVRMPSFPATVIPLHEYKSFDDFLARRLSKAMRKNLRRKFRADEKSAAPPRLRMEVRHEIADCVDELLPLYQQVFARSQFRFEELTREYFLGLGERQPDRARFFIWRLVDTGQAVAFSSCMVHDGTLYDNYLGLDYAHALDLHLYFVTIRDLISWGIAEGLHTYYSTPLNYEPKLHLRFDLAPLDLYVRHVNGFLNVFFRRIAPLLEPTRYDKFLRRFSNFAELNG